MKGSGNDRSLLRAKIAGVIKGLKVWESAEVEIQREEGLRQGRARPRTSRLFRFDGVDRGGVRRSETPAAYAARDEAKRAGIVVKQKVMPKEGGKGLMLRITRIG